MVIFIDVMYYSYFQLLPSLSIAGQAKQLGAVTDSIRDLLKLKNIMVIGDLPITIYYTLKNRKPRLSLNKRIIKWMPLATGIIALLMVLVMVQTNKITILTHQEIYSFHTADIIKTFFAEETSADDIDIEDFLNTDDILSTEPKKDSKDLKFHGIGYGRNLIVIQVEALQNFVINLNYKGQEITPNLNRLIRDKSSIYFDNYFQLIGRGNTSDA